MVTQRVERGANHGRPPDLAHGMTAPVFERGLGPFLMPGGECRDLTRALPKFYGVAVNEKQGALFSGLIVIAKDIDAMHDVSVSPYQVGAVFQHVPNPIRREHEALSHRWMPLAVR